MSGYTHSRTCVHARNIHLVFVLKYRRKALTADILAHAHRLFSEVCERMDAMLIEMEGETDHVHLLVRYPPKVSVSSLVNALKGVSSRRLRQAHPALMRQFWGGHMWSPSYFASSCGGVSIDVIRKYIEGQDAPR